MARAHSVITRSSPVLVQFLSSPATRAWLTRSVPADALKSATVSAISSDGRKPVKKRNSSWRPQSVARAPQRARNAPSRIQKY